MRLSWRSRRSKIQPLFPARPRRWPWGARPADNGGDECRTCSPCAADPRKPGSRLCLTANPFYPFFFFSYLFSLFSFFLFFLLSLLLPFWCDVVCWVRGGWPLWWCLVWRVSYNGYCAACSAPLPVCGLVLTQKQSLEARGLAYRRKPLGVKLRGDRRCTSSRRAGGQRRGMVGPPNPPPKCPLSSACLLCST